MTFTEVNELERGHVKVSQLFREGHGSSERLDPGRVSPEKEIDNPGGV